MEKKPSEISKWLYGEHNFTLRIWFLFIVLKILKELANHEKNNRLVLNPGLANALSSDAYSTSRGILLTRLKGTVLQSFVLPVINLNKLIRNKS